MHYLQLFFFQRRILGYVRSSSFESSLDGSLLVIRCDYPVQEYKESGHIEVFVSHLFCQAQLALTAWKKNATNAEEL